MRDKIIDYYKILLAIGWMVADEDGNVSVKLGDDLMPATIGGKRVVLPTRGQMKNTNWENRVGFHPLRESFNLGISDMVANLRDQYVQRLNTSLGYLMKELIDLAYDQKNQKNLTTDQAQVLNALAKCDERTVKDFTSLLKNTKSRNDANQFINIFIRRGGVVKGVTYGRAGIVTFPIYDALIKTKEPVNGVKLSVKDREMLIKLYEFIFPTLLADAETFNVGVNTRGAPYLESLVRSSMNVIDQIVETAQPYMKLVALPDLLEFPEDIGIWKEIFDSKDMVDKLARTIAALNSNEDGEEPPVPEERAPARSRERDPEPVREVIVEKSNIQSDNRPRGRMILGASSSTTGEALGKVRPDQTHEASGTDRAVISSGREVRRSEDIDREAAKRRETEDREQRLRDREEELERIRRDEESRRPRDRDRDRDYRDDPRDRDRDYRPRDRDRDDRDRPRDRDREPPARTGDIFDDNPVLRGYVRDEEERGGGRYSRGGGRERETRRVRDIRDRGYDDRDRDDRYERDRPRDRYRR